MAFVKVYEVDCPCGAHFVTITSSIRWCLSCRKKGRNKGRRNSIITRHVTQRSRKLLYSTIGSHSEDEWQQLLHDQGWCCHYCGCDMTQLTWTRDHVIPLSKGGTDNIDNIVAACRSCNCQKGTLTASAFKLYILNNTYIQQKKKGANLPVEKVIAKLQETNDSAINQIIQERWITTSEAVEPPWMDEEYRRQSGG